MIRDLYGILAPVGGLAPPVRGAIALRGAAGYSPTTNEDPVVVS